MIHIDFGDLEDVRRHDGRMWRIGALGLMVEHAAWLITQDGKALATSAARSASVDGALRIFVGKKLVRADLSKWRSHFRFEEGLLLTLIARRGKPTSTMDNWTIFRGRSVALSLDGNANFQVSN
jgi:hypothetical protein